jgi:hypothetical protein
MTDPQVWRKPKIDERGNFTGEIQVGIMDLIENDRESLNDLIMNCFGYWIGGITYKVTGHTYGACEDITEPGSVLIEITGQVKQNDT